LIESYIVSFLPLELSATSVRIFQNVIRLHSETSNDFKLDA